MAVRRAALERVGPFDETRRAGRRRGGVAGTAEGRRRCASATSPAPRWTIAARATTRASARSPAPPIAAAAPPPLRRLQGHGADPARGAARARRLRAARPALPLRQRPDPDRPYARPPALAARRAPRAPAPPPAVAGVDDFLSGRSGYVAGKRGRLLRAHDLLHDLAALPAKTRRLRTAPRRRAAPPRARRRHRAPRRPQPDGPGPRRAAALPPRRDDRRRARRRRPRQVREPRRAAGPPRPGDLRLGHRHRRRRRPPARLPGHLPARAPRRAACASPSPPTAATPTPRGT